MNFFLFFITILPNLLQSSALDTKKFSILMPNVRPYRPELYLCTPVKIDYTRNYYMTAFQPNASMAVAHHMLLYGCGEPGSNSKAVWNCGEMTKADKSESSAGVCAQGAHSQIIYAWARDAPRLELPKDVGFKVGRDSPIKYLVLQVHYAHIEKFKDGSTDDSGVIIEYTEQPMSKLAGVLLLGTAGSIPAMTTEHMETACEIKEPNVVLHPFAYRTHTHSLGRVVSGYRVRTDDQGNDQWLELGKRDPLTPQMFYTTATFEPIKFKDRVAARCTMVSNRERVTKIGATNEDEMCNFYLMYYVEGGEPLDMKYCYTAGPPFYYWKNPENHFNHIPDVDASQL